MCKRLSLWAIIMCFIACGLTSTGYCFITCIRLNRFPLNNIVVNTTCYIFLFLACMFSQKKITWLIVTHFTIIFNISMDIFMKHLIKRCRKARRPRNTILFVKTFQFIFVRILFKYNNTLHRENSLLITKKRIYLIVVF